MDGERLLALYALGEDVAAEEIFARVDSASISHQLEEIARVRFALLVAELRSSTAHASLLALVSPEVLRWSSKGDAGSFPRELKRTPLSATLAFIRRIPSPSVQLQQMAGAAQTILNNVKK